MPLPLPLLPWFRRGTAVALLGFFSAVLVVGCGPPPKKIVPVEGAVTVGSDPLQTGIIGFHPDPERGNTSDRPATGKIENGKYRVTFDGKDGAPVGAYKVTIASTVPSNPKDEYSVPKSLINTNFAQTKTTPLTVEVKEGGGPYDFKVTK